MVVYPMEIANKESSVTPEKYVHKLIQLRDNYADEIPDHIISGKYTHKPSTHKVQHNWWTILVLTLEYMNMEVESLPAGLKKRVHHFIEEYTCTDFKETRQSDIDIANELINLSIKALVDLKKSI